MVKEAGMGYTVRVYGRKHYVSLWSRVCKEGEQPELLDLVVKVPPNLQNLLVTRSHQA